MDILQGSALPRGLHLDLWRARCEAGSVYSFSLSEMRGLIEEWTALGVNADLHEHAVLWMRWRLPVDYKTAKKARIDFGADTVRH